MSDGSSAPWTKPIDSCLPRRYVGAQCILGGASGASRPSVRNVTGGWPLCEAEKVSLRHK